MQSVCNILSFEMQAEDLPVPVIPHWIGLVSSERLAVRSLS